MVYLKSDEEVHRKFEEDDLILQMQSNCQEALTDNFQCYKAGYNRGKAEEHKKIIEILNNLWRTEAKKINSGIYAYPFEVLQSAIIEELDKKGD